MNMIQFSNQVPSDQLILIFKDFFEQHIAAYDLLKGIEFVRINEITMNKSSIMYSVKLLEDEDKEKLAKSINPQGGGHKGAAGCVTNKFIF